MVLGVSKHFGDTGSLRPFLGFSSISLYSPTPVILKKDTRNWRHFQDLSGTSLYSPTPVILKKLGMLYCGPALLYNFVADSKLPTFIAKR